MERKSMMSLLVGLTVCIWLWQFMMQTQQEQFFDTSPPAIAVNETTLNANSVATTSTMDSDLVVEGLPKNDISQLIDLDNFEYLITHPGCKNLNPKPLVVSLVHSAADNFNKRRDIRETWGRSDPRALLVFLIGAVNATSLQDKIDLESTVHGDLVQGSFEDAYRNMTYKHVMALKWFTYNCPDARYLLKTDDDVFVNTPLMYNYLERPSALSQQFHQSKLLFCYELSRAKVKRTFRSKWRVSYGEYVERYFPNHCPGFSILYSADIVPLIYQTAQKLPYFWIDDVHITGTVASKLNISIAPTADFFLTAGQQSDLLEHRVQAKSLQFFFASPNLSEDLIRNLWNLIDNESVQTSVLQEQWLTNEISNRADWSENFESFQ